MPVVQCDIRRGRSQEQKLAYGQALTKAVHDSTGASAETILIIFGRRPDRMFSKGANFCRITKRAPMAKTWPLPRR